MNLVVPDILPLTQLLICCLIIAGAAVLQVSTGMGFGMLASPLVALVAPELVPGSILIMGLVVATAGAWKERQNIVVEELKLGVIGRIIGSAFAFILLASLPNRDTFMIIFGIMILAAIALTAIGRPIAFNNKNLFGLSIVSGTMGTMTAVGAPPMALIYHRQPPAVVRPTLNAFFGAGSVLGIISLYLSGWLGWNDLLAAILFLPAMLIGIRIGGSFRHLSPRWLSRILLALSACAAILLIVRGIY